MKLLFLLFSIAFPSVIMASSSLTDKELAQYQACKQDTDCTYAQNGCCDCANGGQEVAIHRKHLSAFSARFQCTRVACTEMARIIPCGQGRALCIKGQCVFKSDGL